MLEVLGQMAALIACGVGWRAWRPQGLDADYSRRVLTSLVYYLLLPALVLEVLWQAPLGADTLRIAGLAALGVSAGFLLSWWWVARLAHGNGPIIGAAVLASAFPNATYMGLPVLEKGLGEWARGVAIQYDLFACTPLLLSLGILFARHYGGQEQTENPLLGLLKIPPLWAALLAAGLNLGGAPAPGWLLEWLDMLGRAVIPLMLISLGMGLRWDSWRRSAMPLLGLIALIQLLITPALVFYVAGGLGLEGGLLTAVVLESGMPSMVLGLVICDRHGLDTGLYAAAVTFTTLLSLLTLPLWFMLAGG